MLMLLDSAGLYFRAFHALPDSMTAPDGSPINAVRGFLDMTASLVAAREPTALVACWDDDWRPQWRVDLLPSYKTHRALPSGAEEVPDLLTPQVPVIADLLAALGIARVGHAGFEADDILGTLARRYGARGEAVEVVTGDRDLIQLVDDAASIRVLYIGRGIRRMEVLDEHAVRTAYGVSPQQYADMSILRGDPSDGLPGIPGIGARTAAGLMERYGSLDALLEDVRAGTAPIRAGIARAVLDGADYLSRAPAVVKVADAPVAELDPTIPPFPHDAEALVALADRWGVEASVRRLTDALGMTARNG